MTTERFATEETMAETTARYLLDEIMARVGVDGLVAAHANAGLMAAVDQHVAAVRDSLTAADKDVDSVALAGYGRSVLAVAQRHGRELPDGPEVDFTVAEWFVLRLVAVCALADELDCF